MFKTETHLHVCEVSLCARLSAADMVKLYHEAGYKTLIVSDHFDKGYFQTLGDLPWEKKIDQFFSGYQTAKEEAEKFCMNVLLSTEIQLANSRNHYLLYGINKAFFVECPNILDMSIETFYPYAKERGVTVVQAHPYRDNVCTPTPEFVDAFEVHNSNPRHENYSKKAIEMALNHKKPMTAGSDAHRLEDIAHSGVITENEIDTVEKYVSALLNGELKIIKEDAEF